MSLKHKIKDYKLAHWLNNLLHLKQLKHNKQAYEKYNIQKPLFSSISSSDFPDKTSQAWLDVSDSAMAVITKKAFFDFAPHIQQQLLQWSSNGFIHLKNQFGISQIDEINSAVHDLIFNKKLPLTHDNKLMFGYKHSSTIKTIMQDEGLKKILSFILGKEVLPFQTLNFVKGSGQRAHSDSIHMTTYPLGYLIAVWIALEDIHPNSGPLFYYPGSHKLPYLLNNDFANYSNRFKLGNKQYSDYEDVIEDIICSANLKPEIFLPKKGDVFIWHANLLHGGMPVTNPLLSRKSMVIHYYAKDVIKYHEITERPSLMDEE